MSLHQATVLKLNNQNLDHDLIRDVVRDLLDPKVSDHLKLGFLYTYAQLTSTELASLVHSFREYQNLFPFSGIAHNQLPLFDNAGTGASGLNLVNLSTGVTFILVALGIPVVKHGNKGFSKLSGSADILEALGINTKMSANLSVHCLKEVGITYLHAPSYFPAFGALSSLRAQLNGFSFFNLINPLLNPARPKVQVLGITNKMLLHLYLETLPLIHCTNYSVVYGETAQGNSLGEASMSGTNTIQGIAHDINVVNIPSLSEEHELLVTSPAQSASKLRHALATKDGYLSKVLIQNALIAARTYFPKESYASLKERIEDKLSNKEPLQVLEQWKTFSERYPN